jgi:hypothetical protein
MNNLFFGPDKTLPIEVCTDVRDNLPADRRYHYRDGRSMAEAAKCWCKAIGRLPEKIGKIVGDATLIAAHFEYPTYVWGGGMAMTDIMAFVPDGVIAVEAKVDEPFDDLVSVWIFKEELKNPNSPPNRTAAIQKYAATFHLSSTKLLDVRYQLLQRTLCAALVANKKRLSRAWMLDQSFEPEAHNNSENRQAFDHFVKLVGESPTIEGIKVQLDWVSERFE